MITFLQRIQRRMWESARDSVSQWLMVGGLLFSCACLAKAMPNTPPGTDMIGSCFSRQEAHGQLPNLRYRTKNIEDIRVGNRVLADNPDVDSPAQTRVDPTTWRKLVLRAEEQWDDGTIDDINVETLQPPEWIRSVGAYPGASVPMPLDLLEMGLPEDLRATVISDEPCPPVDSGAGRLVLTTVNHLNRNLLDLTVQSSAAEELTIRPTAFHRFYRATERAWIPARDLRPGDRLQGLKGEITVTSVIRVPGTQRVFNLTVEGEHVYRVGALGILAHNNGCGGNSNPFAGPVSRPVIVIDSAGNAIPVKPGQRLTGSPNSDFIQVRGSNGEPTGMRLDRVGHSHTPYPHSHVPGVGDHLPAYPRSSLLPPRS